MAGPHQTDNQARIQCVSSVLPKKIGIAREQARVQDFQDAGEVDLCILRIGMVALDQKCDRSEQEQSGDASNLQKIHSPKRNSEIKPSERATPAPSREHSSRSLGAKLRTRQAPESTDRSGGGNKPRRASHSKPPERKKGPSRRAPLPDGCHAIGGEGR